MSLCFLSSSRYFNNEEGGCLLNKDTFIDLEKVRLECIQEKIEEGLQKFEGNHRKQWVDVRFSKPLLEALLDIVKKEGSRV